jgi:PTH2 family peptidyl-tRNA hydrolase
MATSANRDPPTTIAYCIATAILAALGGYFLGQASSLGLIGSDRSQQDIASAPSTQPSETASKGKDKQESESENEEDPDSEDEQQDLQGFEGNANEECKLVLVVRTDLGMTKGI